VTEQMTSVVPAATQSSNSTLCCRTIYCLFWLIMTDACAPTVAVVFRRSTCFAWTCSDASVRQDSCKHPVMLKYDNDIARRFSGVPKRLPRRPLFSPGPRALPVEAEWLPKYPCKLRCLDRITPASMSGRVLPACIVEVNCCILTGPENKISRLSLYMQLVLLCNDAWLQWYGAKSADA
jgi:hypothetical protein